MTRQEKSKHRRNCLLKDEIGNEGNSLVKNLQGCLISILMILVNERFLLLETTESPTQFTYTVLPLFLDEKSLKY